MAAGEGVAGEEGEVSEDRMERAPGTRDSVAFRWPWASISLREKLSLHSSMTIIGCFFEHARDFIVSVRENVSWSFFFSFFIDDSLIDYFSRGKAWRFDAAPYNSPPCLLTSAVRNFRCSHAAGISE